jgi:hypothetical protein
MSLREAACSAHRPTRLPSGGYGRAVKCAAELLVPYPCRKTPAVLYYIPSALDFELKSCKDVLLLFFFKKMNYITVI